MSIYMMTQKGYFCDPVNNFRWVGKVQGCGLTFGGWLMGRSIDRPKPHGQTALSIDLWHRDRLLANLSMSRSP